MKSKFGYLTGDTIVGKKTDQAVENERYAVCLMDLGTGFCDASPDCEKTAEMASLHVKILQVCKRLSSSTLTGHASYTRPQKSLNGCIR